MATMLDRAKGIWDRLSRTDANVIRGHAVPPAQVRPAPDARQRFEAGSHYFSVVISEMFLANGRQWFDVYDPMALVLTEFAYGGKQIAVPYVAGPAMLEKNIKSIPNGMAITDTKVGGLSPYAGGTFALTIVLARVKRESYAKNLLKFVETVAGAFPAGVAVTAQLKVAEALLDGVQSLFGMEKDVQPLIGHRWEYNPGSMPWFTPGFFTLINADEASIDLKRLGVVNGRLVQALDHNAPGFRATDFVLYQIARHDERDDVTELPFFSLYQAGVTQAGSIEDGAWDRAKAGLATLYQEMLRSSDLTWGQTQTLIAKYKDIFIRTQDTAKGFKVMKPQDRAASVTSDLHYPPGINEQPDSERRAASLNGVKELLNL